MSDSGVWRFPESAKSNSTFNLGKSQVAKRELSRLFRLRSTHTAVKEEEQG